MTETTLPDPQVVAWMRGYLRDHPGHGKIHVIAAYRNAHSPDGTTSGLIRATGYGLTAMKAAADAARKPLTVADIPAGQGPASLYVGRPEAFRRTGLGEFALLFKRTDGSSEVVDWPPEGQSPGSAALWDHLAATLPHVTTEEGA